VHKLDTVVEGFARVAVLERGALVEFDSPKEFVGKGQEVFLRACGIVECDCGFGIWRGLTRKYFS
jgi:ABC-type multidrug transport system fused ATPase/permease subunit